MTPREVLVNGITPGETSLDHLAAGRQPAYLRPERTVQYDRDRGRASRAGQGTCPGRTFPSAIENNTVFLRGTVKDLVCAERAVSITDTLGKTVNLLQVAVAPTDPQVLLKVRFANVDRAASLELGANIVQHGSRWDDRHGATGQFPARRPSIGRRQHQLHPDGRPEHLLVPPRPQLGHHHQPLRADRLLETLAEPKRPCH